VEALGSASFCISSAGGREEGFIHGDGRDSLSGETTCDIVVNDGPLDAVAANRNGDREDVLAIGVASSAETSSFPARSTTIDVVAGAAYEGVQVEEDDAASTSQLWYVVWVSAYTIGTWCLAPLRATWDHPAKNCASNPCVMLCPELRYGSGLPAFK
jgi:hypothetical protein